MTPSKAVSISVRVYKPCAVRGCLSWHCGQLPGRCASGLESCSLYCWTEPANGCRICIGSGLWEVRTPKVHSAAGELFWLCRPMGSSPAHFDLLCRDPASAGWDGRGIGAIPRDFARLGSANPLAPFQEGGN